MLVARGGVSVGDVRYASALAFERDFRVYVEDRRSTVWDTRFVKTARHELGERAVICFLLDGFIEWHDPALGSITAPAAFIASQNIVDGMAGATFTHSAGGDPFRSVQLRLTTGPALAGAGPTAIALSPALLTAVRDVADAAASGKGFEAAIARLLRACHGAGLTHVDLSRTIVHDEPPRFMRAWRVIRASHVLLATFPALDRVVAGAGISVRHLSRTIDEMSTTFVAEWKGWREIVHDLRLRWAVMLLSCESVSITDVAKSAGYGSVTALGAALRKVGLPPPREVRRAIAERGRKY